MKHQNDDVVPQSYRTLANQSSIMTQPQRAMLENYKRTIKHQRASKNARRQILKAKQNTSMNSHTLRVKPFALSNISLSESGDGDGGGDGGGDGQDEKADRQIGQRTRPCSASHHALARDLSRPKACLRVCAESVEA